MTQRKRSREQWLQLINEQAESELSVAAFCRQAQLSVSSFYQWRKKFAATEPTRIVFTSLSLSLTLSPFS